MLHHLQQRLADHQELAGQPVAALGELGALPLRLHFLLPEVNLAHPLGIDGVGYQEEPIALEVSELFVDNVERTAHQAFPTAFSCWTMLLIFWKGATSINSRVSGERRAFTPSGKGLEAGMCWLQ